MSLRYDIQSICIGLCWVYKTNESQFKIDFTVQVYGKLFLFKFWRLKTEKAKSLCSSTPDNKNSELLNQPRGMLIPFLCRLRSITAHKDHFVQRLSVRPSVCLCGSHTFLVVTHSYVSQVTHAFLGMLPLFLVHLSRRLKCTIVIMRCPSSVVRPSVVRPSVRR